MDRYPDATTFGTIIGLIRIGKWREAWKLYSGSEYDPGEEDRAEIAMEYARITGKPYPFPPKMQELVRANSGTLEAWVSSEDNSDSLND